MTANRVARAAWLILPIAVTIAFVAIEVQHVTPLTTIVNLDYFPPVDRARVLSLSSPEGWIHTIHPVGYPWLIRLGLELGWDAARIGQALSVLGGVWGLWGAYLVALSVFRDKRWAGVVQAFVAMSGLFLYFASVEGNDMPAAGLQLMSLGVLAASTLRPEGGRSRDIFLAGLIAGLAYLVRYNGMLTAMAGALWLGLVAIVERRGAAWKSVAVWKPVVLYGAAFLLGSALQWIPSLLITGNPFYNDQGQNVWFHVYEKSDFIREFGQAPSGITLVQVIAMDPVRFVQHWWGAFRLFWIDPELALLDAPLRLFGQAGLVFLLLARGPASGKVRGLLAIFVMAHLAALSMMRLDRRFLIILVPILATGAVYLLASLIPPRWEHRRFLLPLNILVLVVGLAWAARGALDFAQEKLSPDWTVIQASNVLHAAGMQSAHEVLSTHLRLQDAAAPGRDRFEQAYAAAPDQESVASLVNVMRARGWRFFIYDQGTGPKAYPALSSMASPETRPPGLVPIYLPENHGLVIYRLADAGPAGCSPVGARFEGGITLECYEVYVSQDVPAGSGRRAGVYLSWRAESRPRSSFKVFVHLLDAGGQLVAQDDSLPVLWTYPTPNWQPGEVIVDFHQFPIGASVPPGAYTLQAGLYDEDTGARLGRIDASGHSIDKVVLATIQVP